MDDTLRHSDAKSSEIKVRGTGSKIDGKPEFARFRGFHENLLLIQQRYFISSLWP